MHYIYIHPPTIMHANVKYLMKLYVNHGSPKTRVRDELLKL